MDRGAYLAPYSQASSHGHGGVWALSHFSASILPFAAASEHANRSQGHGGSWARSHFSTSTNPPAAAPSVHMTSHGQGGVCARSH
jgi:hypothetical protein